LAISLISIQSCDKKESNDTVSFNNTEKPKPVYNAAQYNNTKGYWNNGAIITKFYCPDAKSMFPPIDLSSWDKTPAVNGRFPTYEETMNGTSIHHYGEKENAFVKPYYLKLPKLARYIGPTLISERSPEKDELLVVIQIVQTATDTIVGYRFLSGGVGGSLIRDYHFLSEAEVKEAVGK